MRLHMCAGVVPWPAFICCDITHNNSYAGGGGAGDVATAVHPSTSTFIETLISVWHPLYPLSRTHGSACLYCHCCPGQLPCAQSMVACLIKLACLILCCAAPLRTLFHVQHRQVVTARLASALPLSKNFARSVSHGGQRATCLTTSLSSRLLRSVRRW